MSERTRYVTIVSSGAPVPCFALSAYLRLAGIQRLFEDQKFEIRGVDWSLLESKKDLLARSDLVVLDAAELDLELENSPTFGDVLIRCGAPILPLGLLINSEREVTSALRQILAQALRSTGPLSAANETTSQKLQEIFGLEGAVCTGGVATCVRAKALNGASSRVVYVPPSSVSLTNKQKRTATELYRRLHRESDALFLPSNLNSLELGAIPGMDTFFYPRYPIWHLRALASASEVVTLDPDVTDACSALGVRTATANLTEGGASFFGAAQLSPRTASKGAIEPKNRLALEAHVASALARLGHRKARPSAVLATARNHTEAFEIAIISCKKYCPQALCFLEQIFEFANVKKVHVVELEKGVCDELKRASPELNLVGHSMEDLWSEKDLAVVKGRIRAIQAYMSKTTILRKVLEQSRCPVIYTDVDIYHFADLSSLTGNFGESDMLIFPHFNASPHNPFGIYNAGIVVAKPGAEAVLNTWQKLNLFECKLDMANGFVGDQIWVDHLPLIHKNVGIYRALDHNVAGWNCLAYGLAMDFSGQAVPTLADGRPIKSFHHSASGHHGWQEIKDGWDHLVIALGSGRAYQNSARYLAVTLGIQKYYWSSLHGLKAIVRKLFFVKHVSDRAWIKLVWGTKTRSSGVPSFVRLLAKLTARKGNFKPAVWNQDAGACEMTSLYKEILFHPSSETSQHPENRSAHQTPQRVKLKVGNR